MELEKIEEKIVTNNFNEKFRNRYTYEQVKQIVKIQIELVKEKISYEVAEREILKIASQFPMRNLRKEKKCLEKRLSGIGVYGYSLPSNWAKALLEETNNDMLVIQALNEEQDLYFDKVGRRNEKLDKLLNNLNKGN